MLLLCGALAELGANFSTLAASFYSLFEPVIRRFKKNHDIDESKVRDLVVSLSQNRSNIVNSLYMIQRPSPSKSPGGFGPAESCFRPSSPVSSLACNTSRTSGLPYSA
jgi:hypothetical protein